MKRGEATIVPEGGGEIPDYESYDFASVWRGRGIADAAERRLVQRWALPGDESCLDLGGGFGRITSVLEPLFREVFMLDYSRRNLRTASETLARTTTLVRCELGELPFEDDTFDFVSLIRVMHHIEEPSRLLAEVARVGRDGGTFVMSDPRAVTGKILRKRGQGAPGEATVGPQGHQIYATGLRIGLGRFYHPWLIREEIRGVGLFDNRVGVKFERFTALSSVDLGTSKLWPAKTNLFLRFAIKKDSQKGRAMHEPRVLCGCGGRISREKCDVCSKQYGRVIDLVEGGGTPSAPR